MSTCMLFYLSLHCQPSIAANAGGAGSGKTLAYLLPLLQALREEEEAAGGPVTEPCCPRLIVLTPTQGA